MFAQQLVLITLATFVLAATLSKRNGEPKDWWSGLEDYETYHSRYLQLDCENKHNNTSGFFKQCCHPRLKNADISNIPEECLGSDDVCDDDGDNDTPSAPVNVESSPPATSPSSSAPPNPSPSHKKKAKGGDNDSGSNDDSGNVLTGIGQGTYFLQHNTAGACGIVHSDNDKVVALDSALYGRGSVPQYCGKTITITNTNNGKSVTATVADDCPTCGAAHDVDMSVGAFTAIATEEEGEVPISWVLNLD